jgi:hypothetical protein
MQQGMMSKTSGVSPEVFSAAGSESIKLPVVFAAGTEKM